MWCADGDRSNDPATCAPWEAHTGWPRAGQRSANAQADGVRPPARMFNSAIRRWKVSANGELRPAAGRNGRNGPVFTWGSSAIGEARVASGPSAVRVPSPARATCLPVCSRAPRPPGRVPGPTPGRGQPGRLVRRSPVPAGWGVPGGFVPHTPGTGGAPAVRLAGPGPGVQRGGEAVWCPRPSRTRAAPAGTVPAPRRAASSPARPGRSPSGSGGSSAGTAPVPTTARAGRGLSKPSLLRTAA